MPSLNIGQQGELKSTPNKVGVTADDGYRIVYKNLGNGRTIPLIWSTRHTLTSGAETVVASGIKFKGLELATYCSVAVTVVSGTQDGYVYVSKNATTNIISVKSTGSNTIGVDITWILGANPTSFIFA